MNLQILAAMFPMPYEVHPFAAMMALAAPRVWAAISALKESVNWPGIARASGEVPIVALDQAIYNSSACGLCNRMCSVSYKLAISMLPKNICVDTVRRHFSLGSKNTSQSRRVKTRPCPQDLRFRQSRHLAGKVRQDVNRVCDQQEDGVG